ncbi:hypothetical protein BLNAU_6107 [Blattamonas nauphoetae]|uniref:Uncharacterized protein n=1 Tax=Blattamonas nauphoetae TaxID=2049346 RepID=A0ABQ9Y538_9EUKA|nr:hypothetical protein BLNAU_6107 [Blattamonas nauphoetae]
MKSQHLVVGTGPLFDFGSFIGSGLCGIVGCSVSLSTSSLTNTTSTLLPPRTAPSCSFLTQRLIGVSVLESTNHLCGTSGLSLDWAGSSLLSNCSFSSCTTNSAPSPIAEPTQDPSKEYTTHISKSSRISHEQHYEDEAVRNPVWIVSCAFSDLSASTYGAAVSSIHYRADYVVKDTSFVRCRTTDSRSRKFSFTLFNCWFSNNTGTRGGHFQVQFLHPLTIAKCTFEDSRSKTASPLKQENPIRIFIVGDCRFDNSTVSNNEGYRTGGIWLKQYQALGSVVLTDILFDDNVCTNTTQGNHVYDYMIDGDIGVMKSGTALVVVFSVDFLQNEGLIDVDVLEGDVVRIPNQLSFVIPPVQLDITLYVSSVRGEVSKLCGAKNKWITEDVVSWAEWDGQAGDPVDSIAGKTRGDDCDSEFTRDATARRADRSVLAVVCVALCCERCCDSEAGIDRRNAIFIKNTHRRHKRYV